MRDRFRLGEFMLGLEGVALWRRIFKGSDDEAVRRVGEMASFLAKLEVEEAYPMPEFDVGHGYGLWSETYDDPGNLLIELEEPSVTTLLDELPPGRAVDVGCGTGRYSELLTARGHDVIGIDQSQEMLARARARCPGARFIRGDLESLPLDGDSADLVVCALALTHMESLGPAVAELGRVVRPDATVIISDLHPFATMLGQTAYFRDADERPGFVRDHAHLHSDYLVAFAAAGLVVEHCIEATIEEEHFELMGFAELAPEAARAAYLGMPFALVWRLCRMAD